MRKEKDVTPRMTRAESAKAQRVEAAKARLRAKEQGKDVPNLKLVPPPSAIEEKPKNSLKSKFLRKKTDSPDTAGTSKPVLEFFRYRVGRTETRRGVPFYLLVLMVVVGFFLIGRPTYVAVVQYEQYRELQAQLVEVRAENEALTRELARWSDPQFIESQARERLGYARAGETQYLVLDPPPGYQDLAREGELSKAPVAPWFVTVTTSISQADSATSVTDLTQDGPKSKKDS